MFFPNSIVDGYLCLLKYPFKKIKSRMCRTPVKNALFVFVHKTLELMYEDIIIIY